LTEWYITSAGIENDSGRHFCRGIGHTKNGEKLHIENGLRVRELVLAKLETIGLDEWKLDAPPACGLEVQLPQLMVHWFKQH